MVCGGVWRCCSGVWRWCGGVWRGVGGGEKKMNYLNDHFPKRFECAPGAWLKEIAWSLPRIESLSMQIDCVFKVKVNTRTLSRASCNSGVWRWCSGV